MTHGRLFEPPTDGTEAVRRATREWAEEQRTVSQRVMRGARETPKLARAHFDEFRGNGLWELLLKRDGGPFTSFRDFIETPEPHGWGIPWSELRPILKAEAEARGEDGERSIQLDFEASRVDARKTRPHADDGRFGPSDQEGHGVPDGDQANTRRQKRLRAAARAPEPARDLYRKGLLGVDEAAALGPAGRDTDPDKAALTTAAANAAVEALKGEPEPKTATDRRRLQRKANAAVRETLAKKPADKPDKPKKKPPAHQELIHSLSGLTNAALARVMLEMLNKLTDAEHEAFMTEAKRQRKA